jgi:selenocysteine lyase/cysteine desulfurase
LLASELAAEVDPGYLDRASPGERLRMLGSQRALFDIPRDVCYLNAASFSPLPIATQEAGRAAVARKGQPWKLGRSFAEEQNERARSAAARLIEAEPSDVALIPSISYGVAAAGKVLAVPKGSRVLVLQDDHSSPIFEWQTRADAQGFSVETVPQPKDGDWTAAMLAAIARKGAAPVSLASFSWVHWSDGGMIDLAAVSAALKAQGAKLLVDATHGVGVMALDVKAFDPDVVLFPTYKWTLGPYGRAFMYIARRHQNGVPLEQTMSGRRAVNAESTVYFADTRYVAGARRFDMGERDHFISMEMAAIGMELVAEWGSPALVGRLAMLTDRIAEGVRGLPVEVPSRSVRAPHILSLGFAGGVPEALIRSLAAANIYVAPRLGRMRISPHAYNDEADIDRLLSALASLIGRRAD